MASMESAVLNSRFLLPVLAAASLAALLPVAAVARAPARDFGRIGTLHVPGQPLAVFDIGYVNASGVYALSDRSNAGLDFFRAATGRFLGRATGFAGFHKSRGFDEAGPNGVVAVGRHEFWAGDGDSSVKVVDARTRRIIARIRTGGRKRTDEITYDPRDQLVIAVNNEDDPPFVSFIATRTRRLLGRLELARGRCAGYSTPPVSLPPPGERLGPGDPAATALNRVWASGSR